MDLTRFCSSARVVIVAGKGGVGKTTVTATLATAAARAGASVLIVEVEGKSGLASCFAKPPLSYEEAELASAIRGRTLTPDEALVDYLEHHGLRRISKRLIKSGALEVVASAVPGMKDILVLGKVKALEISNAADLIIIDAPAAGHAITFLMSPRGLGDAVRVGPISKQASEVMELLSDPDRCEVMLVTLPEETPVNELVDTAFTLEDRIGVQLGPVVVNAFYPDFNGPTKPSDIQRLANRVDVFVSPREADDLGAAARFRRERQSVQLEQAERLAQRLPLPQIRLPFLFTADIGPGEIELLTEAFVAGVESLPTAAAQSESLPR
jgi:anion-transporting  ArsA/GET3 family ATPase